MHAHVAADMLVSNPYGLLQKPRACRQRMHAAYATCQQLSTLLATGQPAGQGPHGRSARGRRGAGRPAHCAQCSAHRAGGRSSSPGGTWPWSCSQLTGTSSYTWGGRAGTSCSRVARPAGTSCSRGGRFAGASRCRGAGLARAVHYRGAGLAGASRSRGAGRAWSARRSVWCTGSHPSSADCLQHCSNLRPGRGSRQPRQRRSSGGSWRPRQPYKWAS